MVVGFLAVLAIGWLGWKLVRQNGRLLLRLEALEQRMEEVKTESRPASDALRRGELQKAEVDQEDERAGRFSDRSRAGTKLKRDGLKVGTVAPEFSLPRLDAGEVALSVLRGRIVLLVFSSPHCGPCNVLAPKLEKFYRRQKAGKTQNSKLVEVVMISRESQDENRAKVKEHGLTFPVVLQKQWEVSRDYAMFATPMAYLIDEAGVIAVDVAVGVDGVVDLMTRIEWMFRRKANAANTALHKRLAGWPVTAAVALLRRVSTSLGAVNSRLHLFHLRHFKFIPRPDDIFIATYPRSGTTWMQMILYQLTTDGNMDMAHIAEHCPWFERSMNSANGFENRPSPRLFKTHLPFDQVPKGPGRYIYVARDGRDVAISYYNLYRNYNGYKGTFPEFFEKFMRGKVHYGSWFKHVAGWWDHRNDLNVLFLTYEELTRDLENCVRRIAAFCHLELSPDKLPLIVELCSFAFMKQHESKFDPALEMLWENGTQLNSFLRSGRTGEGARELTPEQKVRYEHAFSVLLERNGLAWPARTPTFHAPPIRNAYAEVSAPFGTPLK
jgi:peroxiredoxin